ncbi:hypothetical protein FHT77_001788 [Rhizobium sp. BK181]|uniref:hypothetical protein n=1 Tax=Rhizobium sp. BK181 TaxID=2587072 RepID=UPI00160A719C|nr:hypothetical protein [Rhizobium sp. BK181]MBB3315923.1 hypothetical protein [Rhizobium sp. BK181]
MHELSQQIDEATRNLALLQEAKRLNGNKGYDFPIRQAIRRLDELQKQAARN